MPDPARVAVFSAIAALAGCYDVPEPDCGFVCSADGACPTDYTCSAVDNRCHLDGTSPTLVCPTNTTFGLGTVSALDAHHVIVVFTDAPDQSALDPSTYRIDPLVIQAVTAAQGQANEYILSTTAQQAISYHLAATGVRRASDNAPLSPATADFVGRTAFNVLGAAALSNNTIEVVFDAAPDWSQALLTSNYSIPGLAVFSELAMDGNAVEFTTEAQLAQTYTVTVAGVTRLSDGEPLSIATAPFAGNGGACPPLTILGDGSQASGGQDLVISLVDLQDGRVELFNATTADIDVSMRQFVFESGNITQDLAASGPVIKAQGYGTVAFPTAFGDETAGGELMLYDAAKTPSQIMDFVCWNTDPTASSVIASAMAANKWSVSTCAPALASLEIERLTLTTGTSPADYDSTSTRTPRSCP